jgi:lipid-A-disaccharide synthase
VHLWRLDLRSCLVIAGEKSGEEHAMSFFPELKKLAPDTQFYGVGGDELKSEGMELLYHLKDFSSMGFSEVIGKVPFYFKALSHLEQEVIKRGTKVAILVDFQGFNMRLAKRLKKLGVKVLYYVAPQAWAWKAHRAQALAENVHTLFTILPFEKKWFHDRGVKQVRSIPHPLMLTYKNELSDIPAKAYGSWKPKLKLLLLPGSRKFEIHNLLPIFIQTAKKLKQDFDVEVHLVKVSHIDGEIYRYFADEIDVWYESQDLTKAMRACHVSLAASGTVTLSTGLFELPTVVCYQASLLNEFVFYNFIKYQGPISLTNIIHDQMVFPEFVQEQVSATNLTKTIKAWLEDETAYNKVKSHLANTKHLLSGEDFSVPQYISQVIHE